ncbi:hypothetical protein HQ45_01455 [Porphyromonas crevioricanis]|uniref:Spondin_N n=1 Tax=Porphyromonas crevioricanis TaxID=393921 RepID=A0A0A2FRF0_9PORP|nr:spondin domain-containing protein [Porphyromonas crevioricanis]KGN90814.1 hypothetical protein HQ45_01455 [Porphyromonas crevioricanis]KGN94980.1 hypothetical protein HQ38_04065 [Porphyromonas crevioricanis]GAD06617.1 hypothetical protein PORCAN_215 [Porphyromonas crevioricanis JCM 13913]SQH73202.1 Uncharacterised protein [Porphyromonas crevioricanis]
MKKNLFKAGLSTIALASMTFVVSCKKNDEMKAPMTGDMRTFTVENIVTPKLFVQSGTFKGVGSKEINLPIILPGQSVDFKFKAGKGQALMFVTMYGKSKDWFFASQQPGINLFDKQGRAIQGDVSSQVRLWDNGTKNDQTGDVESKPIMQVPGVDASKLMNLKLAYEEKTSEFTLTIMNTSADTPNETPFSPGVWAVSNFDGSKLLAEKPFFTPNEKSNPEITNIAQMGNIDKLKEKVEANTGIITGISPVFLVVYRGDKNPIYQLGEKDPGLGLKNLSQAGDVSKLMKNLKAMKGVKGIYVAGNAPIGPGKMAMVQYKAEEGDMLAYATMFGFSNDWFYANEQAVLALSNGNVTKSTALFDSGTGVDQFPGAGNRQALFGGTPQMESNPISKVGNAFPVPPVDQVLRITIK